MNYDKIKFEAAETRKILGIGPYDRVDIFRVLRDIENISLIITKIRGNISGFFMRYKNTGLIVINASRSLGHQYFTAAHEYYHLKYDKGMSAKVCPINKFDDEYQNERDANLFAAQLLVPDEALGYMIQKRTKGRSLTLNDVIFLENYFQVSHKLMLLRLREIGAITSKQVEAMEKNIIKNAALLGYNTELYRNTEDKGTQIYSEYAELARTLLETGKITYGKYEELLLDGGYGDILFGKNEDLEGTENAFKDASSI